MVKPHDERSSRILFTPDGLQMKIQQLSVAEQTNTGVVVLDSRLGVCVCVEKGRCGILWCVYASRNGTYFYSRRTVKETEEMNLTCGLRIIE